MRVTYFDKGEEVINSKKMLLHYVCCRYFLIDVISGFPYDYISDLSLTKSLALFKGLKTVKLFRLLRVNRFANLFMKDTIKIVFKLAFILFLTLLLLHFYTCIWYYIILLDYPTDIEANYVNTWLPVNYR